MKIHKDYAKKKFLYELNDACHMFILHGIRNAYPSRVELHFAIANCIYEFKTGKVNTRVIVNSSDYKDFDEILKIHDKTREITDYLDKTIGYPLEKGAYVDTVLLGKRLTKKLIKLFDLEV